MPNLAPRLVEKLRNVTRCDQALYDASAERLKRRMRAAPKDAQNRTFDARLRDLLSVRRRTGKHVQGSADGYSMGAWGRCTMPRLGTTKLSMQRGMIRLHT